MALLEILKYPDPRLHKIAETVEVFDESTERLVKDMAETMYESKGIGLAATQVDVHQRVIVIDISDDKKDLLVLINPKLIKFDGQQEYDEGCLSVPGFFETVKRYENHCCSDSTGSTSRKGDENKRESHQKICKR